MDDGVCRFEVLGPLVLERDGRAVPVPSSRQRSLLALLLRSGGAPLSRDRLIDELWGERPPASAVSALHVHLSKLRGLLGGLLVLEAAGYALSPDGYEVDVQRFQALVEQARAAPERAGLLLREALGLFRGDPLCDVASEGSVAQWRLELEEMRLQAILLRVEADLAAGAAGELVGELERLVGEHAFEERLWGQLMLALYRAERQADALEAYQRARRLFAGELGLEPGEPLARLQQGILDRDPALLAPAEPSAPPQRPASHLPRPPTRLIGRDRELSVLAARMADPDARVVTLTGAGGVGKTRLLLELARRLEPEYEDGAVFVRLERLTDPALVAAEIATVLAQRDGTDGPSADGLLSYLRGRELLLLVDNFEHLLPAAPLIAELLTLAPRIRVLISSRTALRIRGELTFEVARARRGDRADGGPDLPSPRWAAVGDRACRVALASAEPGPDRRPTRATPPDRRVRAERSARPPADAPGDDHLELRPAHPGRAGGTPRRLSVSRWLYPPGPGGGHRRRGPCPGGGAARGEPGSPPARRRPLRTARAHPGVRHPRTRVEPAGARGTAPPQPVLRRSRRVGEPAVRRGRRTRRAGRAAAGRPRQSAGGVRGGRGGRRRAGRARARARPTAAVAGRDAPPGGRGARRPAAGTVRRARRAGDCPLAIGGLPQLQPQRESLAPAAGCPRHRLGDQEAVVAATGNLFGQALNARDRDEMRSLRPDLLALLTPETSPKSLGWIHYFLALDAYVDGRLEAACEHATLSVGHATAVGHEVMRRPSVQPLAAFALWLVARYAAGVAPETAGHWLAHAERLRAGLDSDLWPECVLRDEAMAVLGIEDLEALLDQTPPIDHATALAEATAWLAARDPAERASRHGTVDFSSVES